MIPPTSYLCPSPCESINQLPLPRSSWYILPLPPTILPTLSAISYQHPYYQPTNISTYNYQTIKNLIVTQHQHQWYQCYHQWLSRTYNASLNLSTTPPSAIQQEPLMFHWSWYGCGNGYYHIIIPTTEDAPAPDRHRAQAKGHPAAPPNDDLLLEYK